MNLCIGVGTRFRLDSPVETLGHSLKFFVFESCEFRGSRGERIDLGQPIATALPDGVPPGGVGFLGLQKRPSTVLRIALSVGSPST